MTKLLTSYAALVAVEEGVFELDDPAGPAGSTVRHLLAHTSGLGFDEHRVFAEPGNRRLYSNAGFDVLARTLSEAAGIEFSRYAAEAVFEPLGMTDTLINTAHKSPAGAGGLSTVADLARFAAELQAPKLLDPSTLRQATREVAFPGAGGVLPGYGHQRPNDWGLGFEIRDGKSPHWTGAANSPGTFGHFGQSGTFLWVDPRAAPPASRSPTGTSGRGRSRPGRPSPTRCSKNSRSAEPLTVGDRRVHLPEQEFGAGLPRRRVGEGLAGDPHTVARNHRAAAALGPRDGPVAQRAGGQVGVPPGRPGQ